MKPIRKANAFSSASPMCAKGGDTKLGSVQTSTVIGEFEENYFDNGRDKYVSRSNHAATLISSLECSSGGPSVDSALGTLDRVYGYHITQQLAPSLDLSFRSNESRQLGTMALQARVEFDFGFSSQKHGA
jgi:hypothetical protein